MLKNFIDFSNTFFILFSYYYGSSSIDLNGCQEFFFVFSNFLSVWFSSGGINIPEQDRGGLELSHSCSNSPINPRTDRFSSRTFYGFGLAWFSRKTFYQLKSRVLMYVDTI
jgi:hypothetical protein